jgi:predicted ATPase/DNA-binding CsgD family transcriptional regulator
MLLSDPTPLIDRERELEAVRAHLLGEAVRLVTLTGPAGIGKTRLALAAARCLESAFPDGVWFVDLAPLHDPAGIDAAIGHALGLDEDAGLSPPERVTAYTQDRRLLLILDNFEHLLPAAGRVSELLAGTSRLKVLITSREPLNLRLEHRLPVAGLDLPDLRATDPVSVERSPAGALFLEHARRVQPDLALGAEDARALAQLLHRLDGIPLAIRIAAAHSNVLSPAAMLSRLHGQALLSTEEARDVPARHHTLRDAIEWSYGLLSSREQAAFRQLSVFVKGWTLEAAEAVIRDDQRASPAWATIALLVDKSLVQADATAGDDRRYRLLQPIREYALERLAESGASDDARDRHAAYYVALAERAEPALWGAEEGAWLRRLAADRENFRAALRWATERGDGALGLRLAGALADFWAVRGYLREGRRWLEEARASDLDVAPLVRAKALAGEGMLAWFQGDYPQAGTLLRTALTLAEGRDQVLTAVVLWRLGAVAALQGEAARARALLERSLTLSRQTGSVRDTAFALVHLGRAFALTDDLERAEASFAEALDLARGEESARMMSFALTNLAQLSLKRRDDAGAARLSAEALRLARAVEFRRGIKYLVGIAALVSGRRGDIGRAVRLLAAVEPWRDWTGEVVSPTYHEPAAQAQLHERARRDLGDDVYRAAVEEAQALSVDQVAELAQACLEAPAPAGTDGAVAPRAGHAQALLSEREHAVLRLIAEGLANKQIATALSIAERTVKAHVTSAMNKLGVDNRAHAAVVAIQRGLL